MVRVEAGCGGGKDGLAVHSQYVSLNEYGDGVEKRCVWQVNVREIRWFVSEK